MTLDDLIAKTDAMYAHPTNHVAWGTVLVDNLHREGKHTLANSLIFGKVDPFGKGKEEVPSETLAYIGRWL